MNKEHLTGLLASIFIFGPAHGLPIDMAEWHESTQPIHGNDNFDSEFPGYQGISIEAFESNIDLQYRLFVSSISWTSSTETKVDVSDGPVTETFGPVPEPATMALLGTGLVVLAGTTVRKKKKPVDTN